MKYFRLFLVIVFNAFWISYLNSIDSFWLIIKILTCLTLVSGTTFFIADQNKREKARVFARSAFYGSLLSLVLFLVFSLIRIILFILAFAALLEIFGSFFEKIDALGKML